MLKGKKNIKSTTYTAGTITLDGIKYKWMVDITEEPDLFGAWLYLDRYGVKEYMFGCPLKQENYPKEMTKEVFLEMVEGSLQEYKDFYVKEYA